MTGRELRLFAARLEAVFPTLHPVRVSLTAALGPAVEENGRIGLDKTWGDTRVGKVRGETYLLIRINVGLGPVARFMVFIHEFAHAMSWRPDHQAATDVFDHAPEWGICEARLWVWLSGEQDTGDVIRPF